MLYEIRYQPLAVLVCGEITLLCVVYDEDLRTANKIAKQDREKLGTIILSGALCRYFSCRRRRT